MEGRSIITVPSSFKYDTGAGGLYWASQIACGNDNGLKVRIFGTNGSLEWRQEDTNNPRAAFPGQPIQIMSCGQGYHEADLDFPSVEAPRILEMD